VFFPDQNLIVKEFTSMKKLLALSLALFIGAVSVFAQDANVRSLIVDKNTRSKVS